jgi:hypothetical protein
VDCYLPYFRQRVITLAFLPFQTLLIEILHGDQLLAFPTFSGALSEFLPPLLCVSFQFLVYCSIFLFVSRGSVCQVWLQHLSEVLESPSSLCLFLCPSHHLGSNPVTILIIFLFSYLKYLTLSQA